MKICFLLDAEKKQGIICYKFGNNFQYTTVNAKWATIIAMKSSAAIFCKQSIFAPSAVQE